MSDSETRGVDVRDDASPVAGIPNAAQVEPTLGEVLREIASVELPARFYLLLQLALPLAAQCWAWGWHRSAGWLLAISAYGIWALCQQRLEDDAAMPIPHAPKRHWLRATRWIAGALAAAVAAALVFEGFTLLLSIGFNCARCAG